MNFPQTGSVLLTRLLSMMLGLSVLSGLITGYFKAQHLMEPMWWEILSTFALLVLTLCWYHHDSILQAYPRSTWLNMAIIGVALIGIPYYLVRSRVPGKKLTAIGWLVVFICLNETLSTCAELAMRWMTSR